MREQVVRDEGDVAVAEVGDSLQVGELYAVVSMDPKEALARDCAFWESKGYRRNWAALQVYYRANRDEMLAGAYSINRSDPRAMSALFAKRGLTVPTSIHSSEWIRNGMRTRLDRESAERFGAAFQNDYRSEIGDGRRVFSVTEFLHQNEQEVHTFFDIYMASLAEATYSGVNNRVISRFAESILWTMPVAPADEKGHLARIASQSTFTDDDARFMEEKLRYALVESLRTKLKAYIGRDQTQPPIPRASLITIPDLSYAQSEASRHQQHFASLEQMHMAYAGSIQAGVGAGRTYGGCASAGNMVGSRDDLGDESVAGLPQDVYGG
jgi:hypothetical protein